jgi:GntR family transcriptional regulator
MSVEPPQAEYRQVARILRQRITDGVYPPGFLLPSEMELAAELGVSRPVVHEALSILRTEGLTRPRRGKGSTVNPIPVLPRRGIVRQIPGNREADGARGAFDAEMRALGLTPRSEVTVERVPAPADVSEELGVEENVTVLARQRLMYVNDVPVQASTSYFPLEIVEGSPIAEIDTGVGGSYSRLAELGYAPKKHKERTRVRPPEPDEARMLNMDPDQRVLAIRRIVRSAEGRVVEVNDMLLPAHQWELEYEWDAD